MTLSHQVSKATCALSFSMGGASLTTQVTNYGGSLRTGRKNPDRVHAEVAKRVGLLSKWPLFEGCVEKVYRGVLQG